jgi:hypothetical protein
MHVELQKQLDSSFKSAVLLVTPQVGGFPNAEWTAAVSDGKTSDFVGYLSVLPCEVDESPQMKQPLRSPLLEQFRKLPYTKDGFPYVLRFSIALPPSLPIGRVCDFQLNTVGWRARLIPFLKSLAALRDTYCPDSVTDPAPEIWD